MSRNPIQPRIPPAVTQVPAAPVPSGPPIVAKAAAYYRGTRYTMVVLLLAAAGWFAYDGWKGWPAENERHRQNNAALDAAKKAGDEAKMTALNKDPYTTMKEHSDSDIQLQRRLAMALPLAAAGFLIWALYNSRGAYKLTGDTLEIPGHPPVKLDEIQEIDKEKWDRKGIAYLTYRTAAGESGQIRLDDFIYEREPTDQIFERVEAYVAGTPAA